MTGERLKIMRFGVVLLLVLAGQSAWLGAEESRAEKRPSCVIIELFREHPSEPSERASQFLEHLTADHPQIRVIEWDLAENPAAATRLKSITTHFRIEQPVLPAFYLQRKFISGFESAETTGEQLKDLLTLRVFWREGCQRCTRGKQHLATLLAKYPVYRVEYLEIVTDPRARQRFEQVVRQERIATPVVPVFQYGGETIVGFFDETTTGKQLEGLLTRGLGTCAKPARPTAKEQGRASNFPPWHPLASWLTMLAWQPPPADELSDLPPATPDDLPAVETEPRPEKGDGIEIPWLGRLQASKLGLPTFTLAIGLIDGFNPCAMWVLLFLLSILVNLKDRRKILAVSGTFVFVSGLAYLAFMAAWLNVFLLIGYMRPAQIVLGLLAIVIGVIHVKDFFAFKWGVSLSIPESAKPGIYARVREIVMAKYLLAAVFGATILAILVNAVELLCSAGLPAMYTQILSLRELPWWQNYLFLLLYITAYMFDDLLMVGVVVITLTKTKLQETGGRWLKLLSGSVILLLGVMMIFCPDWLV